MQKARAPKSAERHKQRQDRGNGPPTRAIPANSDDKRDGDLSNASNPGRKRKHRSHDKAPAPGPTKKRFLEKDGKKSSGQSNGKHDQPEPPENVLLREIQALGGDEADFDLVGDLASDSEHGGDDDGPSSADSALRDDLKALAAELGLHNFHQSAEREKSIHMENDDNTEDVGGELSQIDEHSEEEDGDLIEQGAALGPAAADTPPSVDVRPASDDGLRLNKQFKFEPRADWYAVELAPLPEPSNSEANPFASVTEVLRMNAWSLLEKDAEAYSKSVLASASHKFLSTIMSSGTLSDKVSALTLAIQESPVHNIKAFEALVNLASKRSRSQAMGALGALIDLLGPGLILPPSRRLRTFTSQGGLLGVLQKHRLRHWIPGQPLPGKLTEAHLIGWVYEDWLKNTFFKIIQLLEVWCNDEIEYSRTKSLDFVFALLKEKPEQEANLLRLLVNKLGDRDRKISSRASYLLLQLQNSHPGMKAVIVRAIEQEVLLRPGQDSRAMSCAVGTLNQTILSKKEPQTAENLLRIYFDIFVSLLNGPLSRPGKSDDQKPGAQSGSRKGEDQNRSRQDLSNESVGRDAAEKMVSAVLTGINRAAPFVAASDPMLESQMDTLFRIAHSANFNTSVQALILIQQLSTSRHIAVDRFYRTLYESLLDPRLVTSSKQSLYLNLLLRSLKEDVDTRRVKAFAKRMLQVLGLHQPSFACGILYIVLQLRLQFADLKTLLEEPEDHDWLEDSDLQPNGERHEVAASNSTSKYDGRKRDPEHSNAQHSCLWEILPFLRHFHPSVSVLASSVTLNDESTPKPDLESHSLIRFLDKFVYRNPKSTESTRGVSIMQPVRRPSDQSSGKKSTPTGTVNHPSFWNQKVDQVAAEDVFFHHYFQETGKPSQSRKEESLQTGPESDNNDEDEVWKALTTSHPDGPVDDSDGSDFDLDDFEDDSDSGESIGAGTMDPEALLGEDEEMDTDDEADADVDRGIELLGTAEDNSGGEEEVENDDESKSKEAGETRAARRKRLKNLPTFASADDYADLLAQEEDL